MSVNVKFEYRQFVSYVNLTDLQYEMMVRIMNVAEVNEVSMPDNSYLISSIKMSKVLKDEIIKKSDDNVNLYLNIMTQMIRYSFVLDNEYVNGWEEANTCNSKDLGVESFDNLDWIESLDSTFKLYAIREPRT